MKATKHEILIQAAYVKTLATMIEKAAQALPDVIEYPSWASGTINNLAPELSKEASQLKKMLKYGWNEE